MPWSINENGDRYYAVSVYAKEELPTWSEMYREFYLGNNHIFDPNNEDHQIPDIYWNIPRQKVILATACNQLNKMIFEDGIKMPLLGFIHEKILENPVDIRFTCEPIEPFDPSRGSLVGDTTVKDHDEFVSRWINGIKGINLGTDLFPPIYTIPMPNGKPNPFIIHPKMEYRRPLRIDISKLDKPLCVHPVIQFSGDSEDAKNIYAPMPNDIDQVDDYYSIIDFIMKEMKTYFEGAGVGWKDSNGNIVESDPVKHSCYGAGHDPAL